MFDLTIKELIQTVLMNIFTWTINTIWGLLVLLIVFLITYFSKTRKINKFFDKNRNHKINVYLSSLFVNRFGSVDSKGKARSYEGVALPGYEFEIIPELSAFFQNNSLFSFLINKISKVKHLLPPKIEFLPSPLNNNDIKFTNIITIGSPGYNEVSKYYLDNRNPVVNFNDALTNVMKKDSEGNWNIIVSNKDTAILQKFNDEGHNSTVFIAAGIGRNGTRGAITYLLKNWKQLKKKYKDKEFGLCLEFAPETEDHKGYLYPTLLYESSTN